MRGPVLTAAVNGIYRTPVHVSELRDAAFSTGWPWLVIDLGGAGDKCSLLKVIASEFRFPAGFGGNWDALADCLQDLSWFPAKGWVVVLKDEAMFAITAPETYAMLLKILTAAANDWRQRGRVFIVLAGFPESLPALPDR